MNSSILKVSDLCVDFAIHQGKKFPWSKPKKLEAVKNISFEVIRGECLGIVGESGSGKSTLIRAIAGLLKPSKGEIVFKNKNIEYEKKNAYKDIRSKIQMIFQDPISSLNPRMTIGEIMEEPVNIFFPHMSKKDRYKRAVDFLDRVGISKNYMGRFAHEFSGGQCQRVGIARALIGEPDILLCDESVSSLDVLIQDQIINLLIQLQQDINLTLVFVSHDLSVVHQVSHHILVMNSGEMMEYGLAPDVVKNPTHPYTKKLLSAIPLPDPHTNRVFY